MLNNGCKVDILPGDTLYYAEWGSTTVFSNVRLPFLNQGQNIVFWVRMCLDQIQTQEKKLQVSINPENAEGTTMELKISGNDLLNSERLYFQPLND